MMLIEQGGVPQAALPIQALKEHMRLGSGFADDGLQDSLVESYLRPALAVIEGRTAKVLIARDFLLVLDDWRQGSEQAFPVAPVTAVTSLTIFDSALVGTAVATDRYRLVRDAHRPKIVATGALLPLVSEGGRAEVAFTAGFGGWDAVPADLKQAVFLLAAEYYEMRHEAGVREAAGLPHGVQVLIERWRTVRVLGGSAR
jgi:uncharacterized phiE125 gp8 family phage protein